ncbi:sorbitol dehydrogenase [Scheffersomyces amazonensis]|uniref:sorbitol dehydrogenase n=1 Tax=Scheffersomyces amazonensis TaxID=1078765 RepID=UPI00315CD5B2
MSQLPEYMDAIVFHGPFDVRTEKRKTPTIVDPSDVILKVKYSGLCGSDLHSYRGHIKGPVDTIIGHEFLGTVVAKGSHVKDSDFEIGQDVLSTFTIQCGVCWYCEHGYSGQCDKTNTFGKVGLDGGQAEYVRIPYAKSTLIKKPEDKSGNVDDSIYVLMADIFVTGYYGVKKIVNNLKNESSEGAAKQDISDVTILQLGLGPVGLCALKVLKHFGFKKIVCVDSVPSRLEEAKKLGAYEVINYETDGDAIKKAIHEVTAGVGFDAVLEVVGASSALRTAYDSVRRNGFICSLGMAHGPLPFDGLECYLKNINVSFGRCHAWSLFPEALEIFEKMKGDFTHFIDHKVGLDQAKDAFELFDHHKVNKVVFDLSN